MHHLRIFNNSFSFSGILLLERDFYDLGSSGNCPYLEPSEKRLIGTVKELPHWIELASLYDSIGAHDSVTAIFNNWNLLRSDDLRQGSLNESSRNYVSAKRHYENGFEVEFGFSKNYCLEGQFRVS